MSRVVRRVPLDFDFPLDETWTGYLMPDSLTHKPCPDCDGTGQTYLGWWLQTFSVFMTRLVDDVAFQEQGRPLHPRLAAFPNPPGRWVYPEGHDARTHPGRYEIYRSGPETRQFFESLKRKPSDSDMYAVFHGLLKASGMDVSCPSCKGEGGTEAYPGQDADREAWTRTEPPTGEGWQLWQTVSEGGPVSVPFTSAEALASWMVSAGEARSYEAALAFVREGWAPTGAAVDGEIRTGVDVVGDPDSLKEN